MCDIVESVRRIPISREEMARHLKRLMKEKPEWTIEEIAMKVCHSPQYLQQLLKENPRCSLKNCKN